MDRNIVAALALVVLVAADAVAAAPGNAPVDASGADERANDQRSDRAGVAPEDPGPPDHAGGGNAGAPGEDDGTERGADEREPDAGNASAGVERGPPEDAGANVSGGGPPVDLPGPVPDFVSEIHDAIGQFRSGDLGASLGEVVADLTPGEDSDDAADSNSEDAADGDADGSSGSA